MIVVNIFGSGLSGFNLVKCMYRPSMIVVNIFGSSSFGFNLVKCMYRPSMIVVHYHTRPIHTLCKIKTK